MTRSCPRPRDLGLRDLPRGPRAIAASSVAVVAAAAAAAVAAAAAAVAAAAAAVAAAATVGGVARRHRAEPHAPRPSCRHQRRRQATAALATNRTCSIHGLARLRVARGCGRVERPQAGVVRARSVARGPRASRTQGPTNRGWPHRVGRGSRSQTVGCGKAVASSVGCVTCTE